MKKTTKTPAEITADTLMEVARQQVRQQLENSRRREEENFRKRASITRQQIIDAMNEALRKKPRLARADEWDFGQLLLKEAARILDTSYFAGSFNPDTLEFTPDPRMPLVGELKIDLGATRAARRVVTL